VDIAVAPHQHTNANFLPCGNVRWILCATICSGWYRRRLSLDKRLHLLDYPPFLSRKLKSKQHNILLDCDGYPPRFLDLLLRRFLDCKLETGREG